MVMLVWCRRAIDMFPISGDISLVKTLVMLTGIKDTIKRTKSDLVAASATRREIIKDAGDIIRHTAVSPTMSASCSMALPLL